MVASKSLATAVNGTGGVMPIVVGGGNRDVLGYIFILGKNIRINIKLGYVEISGHMASFYLWNTK